VNLVGLVGEMHEFLDRLEIAHAFGGALALAYYADPRGTMDIDVNIFVGFGSAESVVDAMGELQLQAETASSEWLPVAGIRLTRRSDGATVDLFFSIDETAYTEIRDRIQRFPFADRPDVPFLSAEDLVMFKISFNRAKDWVDIRNLVEHTPNLDINYIERQIISLRGPTMYPRLAVLRDAARQAHPKV
jgi:hypothetical protein